MAEKYFKYTILSITYFILGLLALIVTRDDACQKKTKFLAVNAYGWLWVFGLPVMLYTLAFFWMFIGWRHQEENWNIVHYCKYLQSDSFLRVLLLMQTMKYTVLTLLGMGIIFSNTSGCFWGSPGFAVMVACLFIMAILFIKLINSDGIPMYPPAEAVEAEAVEAEAVEV